MAGLLAGAWGAFMIGIGFLFEWRRFRRNRINAKENPLTHADMETLQSRVLLMHTGLLKAQLRDRLKSEQDWRWAARLERACLVVTVTSFTAVPLLLFAGLIWR